MTRTEDREPLFEWVGPIVPSNIVLIAKKSRGITIQSPEDLNRYTIGAVRDDVGEQLLLQAGVAKEHIRRLTKGEQAAGMLAKDRIDLWAYGRIIAFWTLQEADSNQNDYEEGHPSCSVGIGKSPPPFPLDLAIQREQVKDA